MMERVKNFLSACKKAGFIDKVSISSNNQFVVESGSLFLKGTLGQTGYFLIQSAKKNDAEVVYTDRKEAVLSSKIASALFGRKDFKFGDMEYKNVTIAPVRELDNAIEFQTANGKQFIVSTSNVRVTLGLYDLLYTAGGEHSILMLPELYGPSPDIEMIKSSYELLMQDYGVSLRNQFISKDYCAMTEISAVPPADVPARMLVNSYLFGDKKEDLGKYVPTLKDVYLNSSRTLIKVEKDKGYKVDMMASSFGVNYNFSGLTKVSPTLISSAVSSVGGSSFTLLSGMDITETPLKADIADDIQMLKQGITMQTKCGVKQKVLSGKECSEELKKWTKNGDYLDKVNVVVLEV